MIELLERKPLILEGLKKEWERLEKSSSFSSLSHYLTLSFEISKIDIKGLIGHCHKQTPLSYWADRSGEKAFLGIGALHQTEGEHISGIENIVNENPDLYYVGGMNFDRFKSEAKEWNCFRKGQFILPLLSYQKNEDRYFLKVNFPKSLLYNKSEQASYSFKVEEALSFSHYSTIEDPEMDIPPTFLNPVKTILSPKKEDWAQMVQKCLGELKSQKMQKVVLARKKIYNMADPINPSVLFDTCQEEDRVGNFTFLIRPHSHQAFLSFSPERLFRIKKNTILVDALAGTRPSHHRPEKDLLLEQDLLNSKKDSFEHMVVCKIVLDKLHKISKKVYMTKNMKVMKLSHVQHLHSEFEGELEEKTRLTDIISELHPTPAVGGDPWTEAKSFINSHESFERGLYASPVGFISKNYTEFAVGIRSALIDDKNLHVFGGAGIVLGSTPEKEWEETLSKMKSFEHYL
ncbi:MAG: isochorismate synthase [Bdellovibrionota bacterium]|nr:isochorismate synthase [Bdellovibrionota bacterium]